jgi:hypothetical protein
MGKPLKKKKKKKRGKRLFYLTDKNSRKNLTKAAEGTSRDGVDGKV